LLLLLFLEVGHKGEEAIAYINNIDVGNIYLFK